MARIDKGLLAKRFGMRAATYEAATPVQGRLAHALLRDISNRVSGRRIDRIVELGCGTGRLTRLLRQRFPQAHIVGVELAPNMIARARVHCPGATFVRADAETYVHQLTPGIDVIVSNATVQWFEHPVATLRAYRALLARNGCLALTTFGEQTFRELRRAMVMAYGRERAQAVQRHLLSMAPVAFWRETFPDAAVSEELWCDHHANVRAFLRSLQRAGVTYAGAERRFLPAPVLRRILECYPGAEPGAGPSSGITATYHVIRLSMGIAPMAGISE